MLLAVFLVFKLVLWLVCVCVCVCEGQCNTNLHTVWGCICVQLLNCVQLFETPWPVAHQAALSLGFPKQEYSNGLSFPSLGYLSNPGIKPVSPLGRQILYHLSHQGSPFKGRDDIQFTLTPIAREVLVDFICVCTDENTQVYTNV